MPCQPYARPDTHMTSGHVGCLPSDPRCRAFPQVGKHVAFDTRLTMRSSWLAKGSRDRGAEYALVACVSHHGRSSSMGHYTADVLQPDGRWLRFDDGNVFLVSKDAVLSDRPYLLFYQRVQQH